MRLSEVVGSRVDDIVLVADQPHINSTKHPHRGLKTDASERFFSLVGCSLWVATRIREHTSSRFCFPRTGSEAKGNSNAASAAIIKWIKTISGPDAVIRGLIHGFRDSLRAIEALVDIIDQLGGWRLRTVGQGYGDGYSLKLRYRWMSNMVET
ncbi:MAG: hypothetical protein P8N63_01135 [Pseudomonadales bacterium]|nr:hypothetical protein [Pseudomonadales bacterium]